MVAGETNPRANEPKDQPSVAASKNIQGDNQGDTQSDAQEHLRGWAAKELGLTGAEFANAQTVQRSFLKTLAGETFLPTDEQWDAFQVASAGSATAGRSHSQVLPNYALAEERRLCQEVTAFSDDVWRLSRTERVARFADLQRACVASRRAALWLARLEPALAVDLDKIKAFSSSATADIKPALVELTTALREIFVRRSLSAAMRRGELLTQASKNPVSFRKASTLLAEKLPEVAALDFDLIKKLQVRAAPPAKKNAGNPSSPSPGAADMSGNTDSGSSPKNASADAPARNQANPLKDRSSQLLTKPDSVLSGPIWLLIGGMGVLLAAVAAVCAYFLL